MSLSTHEALARARTIAITIIGFVPKRNSLHRYKRFDEHLDLRPSATTRAIRERSVLHDFDESLHAKNQPPASSPRRPRPYAPDVSQPVQHGSYCAAYT